MQNILINKVAAIIEKEMLTPKFRELTVKDRDYDKARYLYIWILFNEFNIERVVIRDTLPCYKYNKTVYQVIRRMYLRRKDNELIYEVKNIIRIYAKWRDKY
jgi:hypothetical protein